jgi:hypothetical protein
MLSVLAPFSCIENFIGVKFGLFFGCCKIAKSYHFLNFFDCCKNAKALIRTIFSGAVNMLKASNSGNLFRCCKKM